MNLELINFLPFLLNRAGSRVAAAFSEILKEYDVTLPMWRVLAVLRQEDGLRAGQLAAVTSIEAWNVSRLVNAMERQDLLRRQHDSNDARAVSIHLTQKGRELIDQIVPHALKCEQLLFQDFTAKEAAQLKEMLRRLHDNMARWEDNLMKDPAEKAEILNTKPAEA